MAVLTNMSDVKTRMEASSDEIVAILECDTYSKKFIDRGIKSLGQEKADAKAILSAKHVDVDSRLHAFFLLEFMSEQETTTMALDFVEQMFYLLDDNQELKTDAKYAIAALRHVFDGDEEVDAQVLEATLRALYEQTYQTKEGLVFEAFIKLFTVEAGKRAETVAGSARSAAAWTVSDPNNHAMVEHERNRLAVQQVEHLIALY